MLLQVFFESSAVFLFGSDHSQTWIDFFANVGGLLGICIGVSVVTFVELFWLAAEIGAKFFRPLDKQTGFESRSTSPGKYFRTRAELFKNPKF